MDGFLFNEDSTLCIHYPIEEIEAINMGKTTEARLSIKPYWTSKLIDPYYGFNPSLYHKEHYWFWRGYIGRGCFEADKAKQQKIRDLVENGTFAILPYKKAKLYNAKHTATATVDITSIQIGSSGQGSDLCFVIQFNKSRQ